MSVDLMTWMDVSGWMFLLVPAYPGSHRQTAVKWLCVMSACMRVCVCVHAYVSNIHRNIYMSSAQVVGIIWTASKMKKSRTDNSSVFDAHRQNFVGRVFALSRCQVVVEDVIAEGLFDIVRYLPHCVAIAAVWKPRSILVVLVVIMCNPSVSLSHGAAA